MDTTKQIELRILSGPHLGAFVILKPGDYVIGASPACDIVFYDSLVASRHLVLAFQNDDISGSQVTIRPLDGKITIEGVELSKEGQGIKAGEVFSLGFTALAWRETGEEWGSISLTSLEYADTRLAVPSALPESEPVLETEPDKQVQPATSKTEKTVLPPPKSPPQHGVAFWGGLLFLALLIGALCWGGWPSFSSQDDETSPEILEGLLQENGFSGLSVLKTDRDLTIKGALLDDRELARLVDFLHARALRSYLDVRVEDDTIHAVRNAFIAHGFYPDVQKIGSDGKILVSLYMQDSIVEADNFESVRQDAPFAFPLKRHVVYAPQLEQALQDAFQEKGVPSLELFFQAGRIEWDGTLDAEQRILLEEAKQHVEARLLVPVPLFFRAKAGESEASSDDPTTQAAPILPRQPEDPVWGKGGGVMAVTLNPMRFVTLKDGQKYFEGGILPSGYKIISIEAKQVILNRNQTELIYTLGENK